MEPKPKVFYDSIDEVEKYYRLVYFLVFRDNRVRAEDKYDASHEMIKLLMSKRRMMNSAYVAIRTKRFISVFVRRRQNYYKYTHSVEMERYNQDAYTDDSLTQVDWDDLPLGEEERELLLHLYSENNAALAAEEGLGRSAICMRKKRLIKKIKKRFKKKA